MSESELTSSNSIEDLSPEEVLKLKRVMKVYDRIESFGWGMKWLAFSLLAILVAMSQFAESIFKLKQYWFH